MPIKCIIGYCELQICGTPEYSLSFGVYYLTSLIYHSFLLVVIVLTQISIV